MQTIEQSGRNSRIGWVLSSLFAIGAIAALWQFIEKHEPAYLVALTGFLLSIPNALLNPIELRDPMDTAPKARPVPNTWSRLHLLGSLLVVSGIGWAFWL